MAQKKRSTHSRAIAVAAPVGKKKLSRMARAKITLGVTVVVAIGLLVAGTVAPKATNATLSGQTLLKRSMNALAKARYVKFIATGSGKFLPGPVTYIHQGSNYELRFDAPHTLGGATVLVVDGVAYIKGDAEYWAPAKDAAIKAGVWYRWPHEVVTGVPIGGAATMKVLGIIAVGGRKGKEATVDGKGAVIVNYLYTTLAVPLSGSVAPLTFNLAGPDKADIAVAFSYKGPTLVAPKSSVAAPKAIQGYFSVASEESGWYESVGHLLSVTPVFLGNS